MTLWVSSEVSADCVVVLKWRLTVKHKMEEEGRSYVEGDLERHSD